MEIIISCFLSKNQSKFLKCIEDITKLGKDQGFQKLEYGIL